MHWYDWHTVSERLQGRAYALTRGRPYKVILDPHTPTGCCDFTSKRILINPNLFSDALQKMGLTGTKLDKANFLISRAVTGHEALHVLYSDPTAVVEAAKESPILKTVLNLLEDARIEKIGAETSHVSKTLFELVNGIARRQLPKLTDHDLADPASVLHLLLRWRLGADIPKIEPPAEPLWQNVRILANTAVRAGDCAQVLYIAREIVKIAGLDKSNVQDPDVDDLIKKMQSEMAGKRDAAPMNSPLVPSSQPGGSGSGDQKKPSGDRTSDEDANTGFHPCHQETRETRSGQTGVPEEDKPGQSIAESYPDHLTGDDSGACRSIHSVNSNGCGGPEDIEKLIDDTALQVCEDLDSLIPRDSDDTVAKATSWRGRVYSDVVASPYTHHLQEAAPIAAQLIRDLRTDGPRAVSGPSNSPGRFKARYYIRDREKPFSAQRYQGLTTPKMALSLVVDRSGSMEHVVNELRTMSMAITMACENLQIPLSVWALEGQVHVKRFDEHGLQVLAKIAGIHADTLTRVMPTINDAVAELKSRPEELKQIVMIHDGMPSDRGDFVSWRTGLRGIGVFCLFIMRDEDFNFYKDSPEALRERMDELVGPKNYAIAPVSDIAKHWCSHIRSLRNRHSRSNY